MKKAPVVTTGLQKHVKTSHGLFILSAIIGLVALGLFYYVFQGNTENRSKAAEAKQQCVTSCQMMYNPSTRQTEKRNCKTVCPVAPKLGSTATKKIQGTVTTPGMLLKSTGIRTTVTQTSGTILKTTSVRVLKP